MLSLLNIIKTSFRSKDIPASVFELFSHNIRYLPDTTFERAGNIVMKNGKLYAQYRKRLRKKECDLFDFIEVNIPREFQNKNISFVCYDVTSIDMAALEALIKNCGEIYGVARERKPDKADIKSIKAGNWAGRAWQGNSNQPDVSIHVRDYKLEMNIKP